MSNKRWVLAADDQQLAGAIQAWLETSLGRRALEVRFDAIGEQVGSGAHGILLLAAGSAADVEAVSRLIHECYWQQSPMTVCVIAADAAAARELASLDAYSAGRFDWPAAADRLMELLGAEVKAAAVSEGPAPAAGSLTERLRERLRRQTPSLEGLADKLALAAAHDVHVLLTGETGTGKTYLARQIHEHSRRREQPLMVVSCGALVANLVESELFGHARGAFTGAQRSRMGKLEAVGEGTLLLDEIDTLGLDQQAKLLRVVEGCQFEPVGSNRTKHCKARFIFASNVDLEAALAVGRFRKDLYYRIHVISLHLAPLRDRRQDIGPLAEAFVARFCEQFAKEKMVLSSQARAALESHPWPGNIRQLENAVLHAVLVNSGAEIGVKHLPAFGRETTATAGNSLLDNRQTFERGIIQQALESSDFNRVRAASALGISRVTLYKKMKKYGLMHEQRPPATGELMKA
jgi:two-component system response regulator HydG